MSIENDILKLTKQLLPTGHAFDPSEGSNMESLLRALSKGRAQANADALSTSDCLIPDNDNFTADDATDWERRLGLVSNPLVPLADRKAAILRKMKAPGLNPAKSHYLWIQQQLQDAGFNVYVYENIFPVYPSGYTTMNPATLNPAILSPFEHGDAQHGDVQSHYLNNIVANSIFNSEDIFFGLGKNLRSTFFIGAGPGLLGTYANVLATREKEFRQLILTLKQTENIAILFINYI